MPLKNISVEKKLLIGFFLSVVVTIILSYYLYDSKINMRKSTMLIDTNSKMRVQVNCLISSLNKLETDRKRLLLNPLGKDSVIYYNHLLSFQNNFKQFQAFIKKEKLDVAYIDSLKISINRDLANLKKITTSNRIASIKDTDSFKNEDLLFVRINTYLSTVDDQYEQKSLESFAMYQEDTNDSVFHFFALIIIFMLLLSIYFVVVFKDVSEKKKLAARLKESKNELDTILNTVPSLIFVKNLEKKFVMVNNSFLNYFNITKEKILMNANPGLVNRADQWLADEEDDAVLHQKIALKNIEREIKFSDGKTLWFNINKAPLYDNNNDLIGIVGAMNDITKRVEYENKLRETRKELEALNDQKNKFFSIIAHDLRSPFTSLLGFSDFLIDDFDELSEAEKKDFLGQINTTIKNVLELVNNLLDWSRIQFNKIEFFQAEIPLQDIIISAFQSLKMSALNKKIELKSDCPEGLKIFADENMIETVIRNLVNNSIKFTGRNGVVEVRAKERKEDVLIEIIDNGMGMKKDIADNLFKLGLKISTAGTADEKGTGLGLLVCKEFVEMHKSTLIVNSELNKGTVISFALPKKQS